MLENIEITQDDIFLIMKGYLYNIREISKKDKSIHECFHSLRDIGFIVSTMKELSKKWDILEDKRIQEKKDWDEKNGVWYL